MKPTIAELKAAREAAGARLIALRNEAMAEGFQESPEFDAKWDAVNTEYNNALEAEEKETEAQNKRASRLAIDARLRNDHDRISALGRTNLRPDYNPAGDPRSRAGHGRPTAVEWGQGIRLWASALMPSFAPTEEESALIRKCRINLAAQEIELPNYNVNGMVADLQECFINPPRAGESKAGAIRRALASLNTMSPEQGAMAAVPPQVIQSLEVNKLAWGGLLQVATVRTTSTGEDILMPFTDDTTVKGHRISEDGPIGTQNNPKFGQIRWGNYKYSSDIIAVTYEMLRDAFFSIEEFIGEAGGIRLGKIENAECTNGFGASMPRGIVFASPIGVTTASPTAITTDEVIDLEMSVDDAYKNGDRVGFMMNKNTLKYLRKLKDGQGRPFYVLGQETTTNRDELNGKPIYINYDMADVAATADVMLYGDFSRYVIRRTGGTRLVRDPYTQRISNDRDLFAVIEYMDGNLINTGTSPVKKMRMHA